jgi:hypothetical protein
MLLRLVGDFATGLGCAVHTNDDRDELRIEASGATDELLELVGYVALGATRAGVDLGEPLCRLTYRRGDAPAQVTLDFRITDFRLDAARAEGAAARSTASDGGTSATGAPARGKQ